MKKSKKGALIAAGVAIVIGAVMCVVALLAVGFDLVGLDTNKYSEQSFEITEDFKKISIDTDIDTLVFALSGDGSTRIDCNEREGARHTAYVRNDTLIIEKEGIRSIFNFGISTGKSSITVYLPRAEFAAIDIEATVCDVTVSRDFAFEEVKIETDTGDVNIYAPVRSRIAVSTETGHITAEDFFVDNLSLSSDTGKINLSNANIYGNIDIESDTGKVTLDSVSCESISAESSTGDIEFINTKASGKISVESDTGDVKFSLSDANEVFVETDTGDVSGAFLTEKVFITETDMGSVSVPKTVSGGRCEITTDTGNIKFQ